MDLDLAEQRVLGCLIEKRRTTPDGYPLSLNALRLACNQSTNRDPVLALTDDEVRDAATGLHRHGLARIAAAGQGSRTTKYRHTAEEGLPATDDELAVLGVLLLRGPQTRGELRTRSERLHAFESLDEVGATLDGLGRRGLIELLDREPGRKEARYAHRLGHRDDPEVAAAVAEAAAQHRERLIAEGRLPASEADDDEDRSGDALIDRLSTQSVGDDASDPGDAPFSVAPAPSAASDGAAVPRDSGATPELLEALLARIAALEQRVDELEELVAG